MPDKVDVNRPRFTPVVSMRQWLVERRYFDRLRQLRPWGIGNVVQHPVHIGESRERPGQLRIERGWDD